MSWILALAIIYCAHGGLTINPDIIVRRSKHGLEVPTYFDGGFWFVNLTVGDGTVSCQVDTGSVELLLNPGVYKPSPYSVNLHESWNSTYAGLYPNGTGTVFFQADYYRDKVTLGDLTVSDQLVSSITYRDPAAGPWHDCVLGMEDYGHNSDAFFRRLCQQGSLTPCRFGLAYRADGSGVQIMGEPNQTLFTGTLETLPVKPVEWFVRGDITLNDEVIFKNEHLFVDSGSSNIVGPIKKVSKLFKQAGIQAVYYPSSNITVGYYNCTNPPRLGMKSSSSQEVFNVLPKAFSLQQNAAHNCTATLVGMDFGGAWIIGQSFFRGKYVDFNQDDKTVGIANLKA